MVPSEKESILEIIFMGKSGRTHKQTTGRKGLIFSFQSLRLSWTRGL